MREFITELDDKTQNVQLFTTVTTKAEYLEYYRRKILTESIFEIVKRNKTETILSDKARIEIEKQIRARNVRQSHEIQRQEKFEKALQAQMIDTTEIEIEEFSIDDIQYLIDNLPDGYKMVFNLYAIEGYKHKEIAMMLGINEGTSKSQLSHARKILQQQINTIKNYDYGIK